jgi:hypothetical protein
VSARRVIGTYWEAQRGDGTPFREFATRKQAMEYVRGFRRLDATGAGRRIVKVTRYAGRSTALDLHDAVVQAREEERSIARAVQTTMVETHDDYCARAVTKAVAAEREACAEVCEKIALRLASFADGPITPHERREGQIRALGAADCLKALRSAKPEPATPGTTRLLREAGASTPKTR